MYTYLYIAVVIIGSFLAYLYGRHTKKFLWREYLALCIPPFVSVMALSFKFGFQPIKVFIFGMFFLPILEWLVGLTYHKTLGSHLWHYERYALPGKYTSFLTLPIWGAAAVLFWLVSRNL